MEVLEHKNNFIIMQDYDEDIHFISYETAIATYSPQEKTLYINFDKWDCSQTTLKQLKYFINDYTTFLYESKKQFEKLMQTNANIKKMR